MMTLLLMSRLGAVLILAIIAIRSLIKHSLPKRTLNALWGLALLRLMLPLFVPSPLSIFALAGNPKGPQAAVFSGVLYSASPGATAPSQAVESAASSSFFVPIVWAVGAILCSACFLMGHLRYAPVYRMALPASSPMIERWKMSQSLRRPLRITQSDQIGAALTYGVFRPVILLPKGLVESDEKRLLYVLTHEVVHIRRYDTLMKWLLAAALCMHWFNPLVWVMYVLACRDMELACDERVIRQLGEGQKSAYALALLDMEEDRTNPGPLCSNFSTNAIEERIRAIMKLKKNSMISCLAALLLVGGVAAVFATSAAATGKQEPNVTVTELPGREIIQAPKTPTQEELIAEYGEFGISFDANGVMLFNEKPVRYFWDGYMLDGGSSATHYEAFYESGVVDVYTKRTVINNPDGSFDPFGRLIEIVPYSRQEFEQRDLNMLKGNAAAVTMVDDSANRQGGVTFAQLFEKYKAYGIEYKEDAGRSGQGNVYFNGELVMLFVDESEDGVFSYQSADGGKYTVHAVYDGTGALSGMSARVHPLRNN